MRRLYERYMRPSRRWLKGTKIPTMNAVWKICSASERSLERSITVTNMMGAKITPRFSVRVHDGA